MNNREREGAQRQGDRQFVSALSRGLAVLSCFMPSDRELGNHEISARTNLPKSTVSRLTHTLAKTGYLRPVDGRQKYALGETLRGISRAFLAVRDLRAIAEPHMQELANLSNASVDMAERRRYRMECTAHCHGESAVTVTIGIGARMPIAYTSLGRAYLSAISEAQRTQILSEVRAEHETGFGDVSNAIARAVHEIETLGFTGAIGDWLPDVSAVAAPLALPGRDPVAFNVCGPSAILTRERLYRELGPKLVSTVEKIRRLAED
ncbi:MAG: IclR family transcriptional regulator [Vulcanimicrobiaceae bacterium]